MTGGDLNMGNSASQNLPKNLNIYHWYCYYTMEVQGITHSDESGVWVETTDPSAGNNVYNIEKIITETATMNSER